MSKALSLETCPAGVWPVWSASPQALGTVEASVSSWARQFVDARVGDTGIMNRRQEDISAAAVEVLQKRSREIMELALRDAPDFEQAETSISMALLFVWGTREALQREPYDLASAQSVPGRTVSPVASAQLSGSR